MHYNKFSLLQEAVPLNVSTYSYGLSHESGGLMICDMGVNDSIDLKIRKKKLRSVQCKNLRKKVKKKKVENILNNQILNDI